MYLQQLKYLSAFISFWNILYMHTYVYMHTYYYHVYQIQRFGDGNISQSFKDVLLFY